MHDRSANLDSGGIWRTGLYSVDLVPPKKANDRFIAHSEACQIVHIEGDDDFNCFCTETAQFFGEGPRFRPATVNGPSGFLGADGLTDVARASLKNFIAKKPGWRNRKDDDLYEILHEGEIRVLELFSATFDAPLEGELHVVSIDFEYPQRPVDKSDRLYQGRQVNNAVSLVQKRPVWYTALSHTWGAPLFDQTVQIGRHHVKITSGLATAMRHLRLVDQSIFLWIDQISINQTDIKEKETQVPLMDLIYTRATNTLIWLGEDDGAEPQVAVGALQDIHARLQLSDVTITPDDFERLHVPLAHNRSWWAVRQLFRRPWFTRTWTIQEACLSRYCYLQCGTTVFSWDDIASWSFTLEQSGLLRWLTAYDVLDAKYSSMVTTDLLIPPSGGKVICEMQQTRLVGLTTQGPGGRGGTNVLLGCLVMARYAAASEPKDKVYGVLGFADVHIKPRYSEEITYRDVYQEASITQLMKRSFPLLSCVDSEQPLRPSWVPDWNTPRVTQALGYSTKSSGIYMAGEDDLLEKTKMTSPTLSEDGKRITFRGKIFDKIAHVGSISIDPILCIDTDNLADNRWASYVALADNPTSHTVYSTQNGSLYSAFFQTLMAGRDGSGTSTLSPDHSEIFSLILDSTTGHEPSLLGQTYSARRKKGHFRLETLAAKTGAKVRRPVQLLDDMRIALRAALHMRRFAVTERGYFALVPRGARVEDEIVVFEKCCVPFLLRSADEVGKRREVFELVGETYVHGIMKGEAMGLHDLPLRDVTLV